jgi:hypothetical protein
VRSSEREAFSGALLGSAAQALVGDPRGVRRAGVEAPTEERMEIWSSEKESMVDA